MDRTARVAAHLEEGFRLAASDEVPHLRLALLLFDSAVELLMHRRVEHDLRWDAMRRSMLERHRDWLLKAAAPVAEVEAVEADLEASVLSRRKVKELERDFGAKALHLQAQGFLAAPIVRALTKLHQYRNETYHRDIVREGSLRPAVRIYGYLACVALRDIPPSVTVWGGPVPAVLRRILGDVSPTQFATPEAVAEALLAAHWGDGSGAVASDLADHISDRLTEVSEALSYAADFIGRTTGDPGWDQEAVLHYVQIEDLDLALHAAAADVREIAVQVTMPQLMNWRDRAVDLSGQHDVLAAFVAFADLEDEFEPVETDVLDLAASIDDFIQDEVDRLRGK